MSERISVDKELVYKFIAIADKLADEYLAFGMHGHSNMYAKELIGISKDLKNDLIAD
jgi:hypothetical protein